MDGQFALASAAIRNRVLAGCVDERGLVTSEHRCLAIAQRAAECARRRWMPPGPGPDLRWRPAPVGTQIIPSAPPITYPASTLVPSIPRHQARPVRG